MIEAYLADYDYNLPLLDAEVDPDLSPRRRMMASIGRHVGLDCGYYDAQALAAAMLTLATAENGDAPDARRDALEELEDLLARDDLGFQKALYRLVSIVQAADAAADLSWLTRLMGHRADMVRPLEALGLHPAMPR